MNLIKTLFFCVFLVAFNFHHSANAQNKINFASGEQTAQIPPYDPQDSSKQIPSYQVFLDGKLAGVVTSHISFSDSGERLVAYTVEPKNGANIKMLAGFSKPTLQIFQGGSVTLSEFIAPFN